MTSDQSKSFLAKGFERAIREGLIPGARKLRSDYEEILALKERLDAAEARIADLEAELYGAKAELGRALLQLRS